MTAATETAPAAEALTATVEHPARSRKAKVAPAPAATPAPVTKPARKKRNGVVRPQPEGVSGQIWALADKLEAELGRPVRLPDVREKAQALGLNETTVGLALGYRRRFHKEGA